MSKIIRNLTLIPVVLAVSACSGGGGGGTTLSGGGTAVGNGSPDLTPALFSTLRVFSGGDGVGKGVADDGSKVVFIGPDIANVVAAANDVTQQNVSDIAVSDFPIVQSLPTNANLRQGAISSDGVVANVTTVEDLGGEAGLVLLEIPNVATLGMAIGSALTGNPVGTQTYSGTMTMGVRGVNPSSQEFGDFSMAADFDAGTYLFDGSTSNNSLSGNGVIDIQSGTFSSNDLNALTSGVNRTATMYGQLHGSEAASVSGVFHTNEATADFAGGFVGSRP